MRTNTSYTAVPTKNSPTMINGDRVASPYIRFRPVRHAQTGTPGG